MNTPQEKKAQILPAAFLIVAAFFFSSAGLPQGPAWQREITAWREQHAAELQKPDGWLALAGLEWLDSGDNSFGSAADNKIHMPVSAPAHLGLLPLEGDQGTLNPAAVDFPQRLLIDGTP